MYELALVLSIVGLLALVLVRSYLAGRTLISRRRLVLRIVAGVLLLALFMAVFVGLFVLKLIDAQTRPQLFLVYWSSCMLLAIVLIWVMLADLQDVEDKYSARQREIWRDMARFVAEQTGDKEAQKTPSQDENSE